ncbi:MAG: permease [Caulobacteraceae bacterium]|nr:permease [Caulobacter sp.]
MTLQTVCLALIHAVEMAAAMGWQMLWALMLGFMVSGAIQAVVSRGEMAKLLPDDSPKTLLKATLAGAASSSCSYAATAIARAIVRKGGDFTAAMAFQFASTNLVLELGLILWTLLGWRFTLAQFVGGALMILFIGLIFHFLLPRSLKEHAEEKSDSDVHGKMEGHAEMDMAVEGEASPWKKLVSPEGFTAVSHFFVSDWAMLWGDLLFGVLISGAIAAWVPHRVWAALFFTHDPAAAKLAGPLVGPVVAVFTFICSVGNIPLAAVLWNAGASFGGVIAFIFADLIVLPILDIYRRYYGWKAAAFLLVSFFVAMAASAYVIEGAFGLLHLTPQAKAGASALSHPSITWNYTTWLNLIFAAPTALLAWRFAKTGGPEMLAMMEAPHGSHRCG